MNCESPYCNGVLEHKGYTKLLIKYTCEKCKRKWQSYKLDENKLIKGLDGF